MARAWARPPKRFLANLRVDSSNQQRDAGLRRGFLENFPDGLLALDCEWRIVEANRAAESLFCSLGIPPSLAGRKLWEILPGAAALHLEKRFKEAADLKTLAEAEFCLNPSGHWLEARMFPAPGGFSLSLRDITERKRAEAELRQSEEKYRAAFNQASVGMSIARLDGTVETANQRCCEMLGYTTEEMRGATSARVTHPDDLAETLVQVNRLRREEISEYTLEKRFIRKDRTAFWSRAFVALLKDASSRPQGFVGVIEDISGRKQTEESARAGAERLRLALAAGNLGDWNWDAARDAVTLGPEAAALFGLPAGTPIRWDARHNLIHEDDRAQARAAMQKALAEKSDYRAEYRVPQRDGSVRWVMALGRGVYGIDGSVLGMNGVFQDITERKHAENAALRLAAVVESSDDSIISMTLEGVVVTWNRGAWRMFGYSQEEIAGKSITILSPPDRQHEESRILDRIKRGEHVDHFETIRNRKDGSQLNVSLSLSPIYDHLGRIIGVSKISRDITERKQAENAALRLAAVVESSDDSIISMTLEGIVVTWNRGAWRMFGYSQEEIAGKSITILSPPDRQHEESRILGRIKRGEHVDHFETIRIRKDGFPLDVSLTISPIYDSLGNIIGVSKISRDITERKRAEQELQQQELLLRAVTNESRVGLVMVDEHRRYLFSNAMYLKILGLPPDTRLAGKNVEDVTGAMYERIKPRLDRAFEGQRGVYETRLPSAGEELGERIYEVVFEAPRRDSPRPYVIVVIVDVTERKQAQDALLEAQRQLSEHAEKLEHLVAERTSSLRETIEELESFSYSISHDMRAPLRAMQSFALILAEECYEEVGPEGREYIRRITSAAERMDHLIQDVLNYSRVARADLRLGPVDAKRLLQDILESYPSFQPPAVDIRVEGEFPKALGAEALLTQCFSNLLGNGVKFVETGVTPRVRVWAETRGQTARIHFKDNGVGIDPQSHAAIFGMFHRLSNRYAGTGIGLAIVKKAAERMGGAVGLESAPGKGSVFWLDLKISENSVE